MYTGYLPGLHCTVSVLGPGIRTYRKAMAERAEEGGSISVHLANLGILAVSFEVEGRMIAQNDPLDEAVHSRAKIFFQGCQPRQGCQKTLIFDRF